MCIYVYMYICIHVYMYTCICNWTLERCNWTLEDLTREIPSREVETGPRKILATWIPSPESLRVESASFGRGDATVGNPHGAQISRFYLFVLTLSLKLDSSLSSNSRQQYFSQQYPPPLLGFEEVLGSASSFAELPRREPGASRQTFTPKGRVPSETLIYPFDYCTFQVESYTEAPRIVCRPRWKKTAGANRAQLAVCVCALAITPAGWLCLRLRLVLPKPTHFFFEGLCLIISYEANPGSAWSRGYSY